MKAGNAILAVHNRNVFPDMNVTWGTYPRGAAVRLGMNRSTLQFRLKKLGIVRPDMYTSLD